MRSRTISILLLFILCPILVGAQNAKFFRDKLGKPSELYHHKSGVDVLIDYDDKGQVCGIKISDPAYQQRNFRSFQRLSAVTDELLPVAMRGTLLGRTGEIGNCTNVRYMDYERVFIEMNENACYAQWIRIYFKRGSCPQPPQVQGLAVPLK